MELICEDLKFRDKQNDFKYMLVNDRLKSSKKQNKKNKNINQTKKIPKQVKGKSKFYTKYQDRIESIQESDIKLKERTRLKEKDNLTKIQEKLKKKITRDDKTKKSIKSEENNIQPVNKINKLDDEERKKIIDTINKLRK
jgi:hypothetical protein